MSDAGPFRLVPGSVLLDIRLTPKGGRDAVEGLGTLSDGRRVVLARVRAIPEKGAANAALESLIAGWLGISRSAVSVASGQTARLKTLRVDIDPKALAGAVAALPPRG